MRPLTPRQIELLTFIYQREIAGDPPPTLREIGRAMGIRGTNAVEDKLVAVERRGLIRRERGSKRTRTLRLHAVPVFAGAPAAIVGFVPKGAEDWTALGWRWCGKSRHRHLWNVTTAATAAIPRPPTDAELPEQACTWHGGRG